MPPVAEDLQLLEHSQSPKRRAAAKRLRKLGDLSAGPALLAALRKEVEDPRTWETQYQLVMALGECKYKEALQFLSDLAASPLDATMIYVGLGDALVRIRIQSLEDGVPIIELMKSNNQMLVDGAFRAMAMLKMMPSPDQVDQILQLVSKRPINDPSGIWPLAAAAGWSGNEVTRFIDECSRSALAELTDAAEMAAKKKYKKWSPL